MAEREQLETRATHCGGIAAGLMAAGIVAWWSRPDIDPGVSPAGAVMRDALWLLATVIAATLGMALAGGFAGTRGRRRLRAAMNAAAVWVLIPPLLLLFVEASPKLLALVAGMAAGLAVCLWAVAPAVPKDDDEPATAVTGPTFAELPPSKSGARQSALIAVCLEAAL